MTFRPGGARWTALLIGLTGALLTACPPPAPVPDGGDEPFDAGNPPPADACSGGCSASQICDTHRRVCIDACGGCDAGTCVKLSPNVYQCQATVTTCNGNACEQGQVACLAGACSCLSSARSTEDTCRDFGKWCNGSTCNNPKRYEQCLPGGPACPTGHICEPVFGDLAICVKDCGAGANVCDRGEFCGQLSDTTAGCLASGLFRDQECNQHVPVDAGTDGGTDGGPQFQLAADGGFLRITVPVSNTCLLKDGSGVITDQPGLGSGNCTYAIFKFWDDGIYPFRTCRPPGQALEGQPCRNDYAAGTIATQCATGLECALTRGGDQGVCLRMCNANTPRPGFTPKPSCGADEACVNLYRLTDPSDNAVLGACMKTCDVFDGGASVNCANVGAAPTSCVPTTADGVLPLSLDGKGVCVPQQPVVSAPGATCTETDAFRGAVCGSAQLCSALHSADPATCISVCDLTCSPSDGGTGPARCDTQPNARCGAGKTCTQVTSTTGARVGYCL